MRKRFILELEDGTLKGRNDEVAVVSMNPEQTARLLVFSGVSKAAWKEAAFASNPWFGSVSTIALTGSLDFLVLVPCDIPNSGEEADLNYLSSVNCWVGEAKFKSRSLRIIPLFSLGNEGSECFLKGTTYSIDIPGGTRVAELKKGSLMWSRLFPVIANSGRSTSPILPDNTFGFPPLPSKVASSSRVALRSHVSDSDEEEDSGMISSKRSRSSIGKKFSDLDGIVRWCINPAGNEQIAKSFHLFRLLDPGRIQYFLNDNKLDVGYWRKRLGIFMSAGLSLSEEFVSLRNFPRTSCLLAWEDQSLFLSFLECEFSALDWSAMSLDKFLAPNDRIYYWTDTSTYEGRKRLTRALFNLQLMMVVHFSSVYHNVFLSLMDFLMDEGSKLSRYLDIYLRSSIESMLAMYFCDVKSSHPVLFPGMPLNSPSGCAEVLRCHIQRFISIFHERPIIPHSEWFGTQGGARNLVVDEGTYQSLLNKEPFQRLFLLKFPVSHPQNIRPSVEYRESPLKSSDQSLDFVSIDRFCVWHVLGLLKVANRSGELFSCRKGCIATLHCGLGSIKMSELLASIGRRKWTAEFIDQITKSVRSMKNKFRSE